jgi:hypothetical protein
MRMHGEGLRRCQLQLVDLLAHIPRDELNGGLHFGHHTRGFLDTIQARLAEVFVLGNGADRVDVALDIPDNELPIATHAALHVHKVVGVANGADALGDLFALPGEPLVLVACGLDILGHLLQARCRLWGAAWATLVRLAGGVVDTFLHQGERLCRLHNDLCGSPLFDGQWGRDRLAQFILHMEEVRRVMRPKVMFHIGEQARRLMLADWIPLQLRPARACSIHACQVS